MSIETGTYPAFGIGLPLAVLGFLSYLNGTRKSSKPQTEGKRKRPIEKNAACDFLKQMKKRFEIDDRSHTARI
ncbi:MAG: hypothetical protein M3044_08385 [Thermoproteota archaeon]|nr:hypothetical protein [Thermoproteota archaeon]